MSVWSGILFLAAGIGFLGCPGSVEDPIPPERVELLAKSMPEAWVETGIDADNTGADRIVIMWYASPAPDLAGYRIYRADTTRDNRFREIGRIDLLQHLTADTLYYDDSLSAYVDYYYFVCALDHAGNLSEPSDTVTYRLIAAPFMQSPVNTTLAPDTLVFAWRYQVAQFTYFQEYIIRLDRLETVVYRTVWITRYSPAGTYEKQTTGDVIRTPFFLPDTTTLLPDNVLVCNSRISALTPGLYRWKVKAISEVDNSTLVDEASGESEWAFFSIE